MQKTHMTGDLIRRCSAASAADNVFFPYMDGKDDEEALNTAGIEKFLTWDDLHNAMLINSTRNSREEFLQSLSAGLFRRSSAASSAGHLFSPHKNGGDDEEALCWAAIERLPSFDRMRRAIVTQHVDGIGTCCEEIDVTRLDTAARRQLMEKILPIIEEDNERLLLKLRHRVDKVNIELPSIEVRFEHLSVNANVNVGSRALPTLYNFTVNALWDVLSRLHLVPSKKRNITILNDVTGIIRPSRMTLLLGPPRSGRTTFLLALAGKLDSTVKVSGRITYNGHEFTEFVPQRTSVYISQNDVHIGQMTVRETMDFSGRCQGVGTRYEILMELLRREKLAGIKPDADVDVFMKALAVEGAETSLVTDYILKILGLDVCADTMIGDEMLRGVSGGQKKRVTMAEMLVGPAQALFMDEISTGLDSSTTFQIVKCLRQSVHHFDGTMVVALLQPPPETFELFDDIILFSESQIVYQGPRESILNFFEHLGFKCPERKSIADFLQEVTSRKDQQQYWAGHNQPYRYVPVDEFVKGFKAYHVGQHLSEDLAVPYDKSRSHPTALATEKYGLNQWGLLKACLAREMLLMRRNTFVYMFGTVQVLLLVIIDMTVFLQTKSHQYTIDDANPYMGSLFSFLMCALFNGYPELSLTVERLPVYYKQRSMLMYPAWAYTIPAWLATIPISFLQMGVCVALSYYVVGFAPHAERFLKQFLVLFLVHQVALGLFRFVASIGSNMVVSMPFANFALVVVFLCGGFIISKENIPVWWNWGFWASPLMYGQNALVINEFLAPRWEKPNPDQTIGEETLGRAILKSRGFFMESYWYWIGIGALCGYIVFFNVLFTICLAYLGPVGKGQRAIPQDKLDEEHTSQNKSSLDGFKMEADIEFQGCHSTQNQHHALGGVILENGMILPFQPLVLAFDNISYYVDMPLGMRQRGAGKEKLQLLRNVSGSFRPGVLTSLVGVSGAGKTTLMDVLAGRKTGGYIEGSISVSGYPKKQETFTRISGYCEQTDIHSPNLTVYESLIYSAWLRLDGNVDQKTRKKFVFEVMELVELSSIKDALIGLPGVVGLSIDQRKRLTIAVELVANPSIIFMDEPTSGLDGRAAAIVMRTVRNIVNTGRTVVCTIHQPSIDIFEVFDEILLMKRGGEIIYAGPLGYHSQTLISYFESIPGVSKIREGCNPATWILEVSSQATESLLGVDFAEIFRNSGAYKQNQDIIREFCMPSEGSKELYFPTIYPQNVLMQCVACLWKQHKSYWRNPHYNVVRFIFTILTALIFGSVYWDQGQKLTTRQELLNIMGGLYTSVLFLGINNVSSVQPVIGVERIVFYRENGAGMYSPISYAVAQALIEIPYNFVQAILYCLVIYAMYNFDWSAAKFFSFIFFQFCCLLYLTYYGMMCVAVSPSYQVGAIISSACVAIWNLFAGFLISPMALPVWWRWYYWLTPIAWTLNGIITSQMGDVDSLMSIPGQASRPVREFLAESFGYEHSFLGVVGAIHVVFTVLFAVTFAFCIKYLNFRRH